LDPGSCDVRSLNLNGRQIIILVLEEQLPIWKIYSEKCVHLCHDF